MQNPNICSKESNHESGKYESSRGLPINEIDLCDKPICQIGLSVDFSDANAGDIIRAALKPCLKCKIMDRYECDDFKYFETKLSKIALVNE
jgi:hypothetical protein